MIISSSIHTSLAKFGTGSNGIGGSNPYFNRLNKYIQIHVNENVNETTSFPAGYRLVDSVLMPITNGGISGRLSISVDTFSGILGYGYIDGSDTIIISTTATGDLLANINGNVTITITTSGIVTAYGFISGTCDIGAQPSAYDIAQAVLGLQIEGDYSMRDLLRIMSSVLAGRTSITGSTATFRDVNNTVDRVVADMSGSERIDITLDAS